MLFVIFSHKYNEKKINELKTVKQTPQNNNNNIIYIYITTVIMF